MALNRYRLPRQFISHRLIFPLILLVTLLAGCGGGGGGSAPPAPDESPSNTVVTGRA